MNKKTIIPFIDLLFTLLMVFICIIMLVKFNKSLDDPAYRQNAVFQVILNWEGNSDIDLWGRDPEGRTVGFSRREGGEGSLFSLNRDNLGTARTEIGPDGFPVFDINEEIVSIRGCFPGEYIFNAHDYNHKDADPVICTIKLIQVKPFKELIVEKKELKYSGDQATFFRFTVNTNKQVVGINHLQMNIVGQNN